MTPPGDWDVTEEKRVTIRPHEEDNPGMSAWVSFVIWVLIASIVVATLWVAGV